jgi:hypothetical protein
MLRILETIGKNRNIINLSHAVSILLEGRLEGLKNTVDSCGSSVLAYEPA